jgi:membrane protein
MAAHQAAQQEELGSGQLTAQRQFGFSHQFRAIRRLRPAQLVALLTRAYGDWSTDGATRLGAALAYFTLFSIAPVLVVVTGVVGIVIGQAAAHEQIAPWLQRFLSPDGARAAELMLKQQVTPAGGVITTLIGLATLFLVTSAFVNELRQSLNMVWRVQTPPSGQVGWLGAIRAMLTDRLYSFLLAAGAGVVVLLSLGVNTGIAVTSSYFPASLPVPAPALHILHFLVSLLLLSGVFTLVYKILPDAHLAWGDAWMGGIVTALLFDVGGFLLSAFVGYAADSPYGTAAGVLALLAWVYYSAQVFFFGAELTRIFATTYGGGIVPVHRSLPRPARWQKAGAHVAGTPNTPPIDFRGV